MTKAELLSALEHVPDAYEIEVQVNSYHMEGRVCHDKQTLRNIERVDPGIRKATIVVRR